MKWLLTCVVLSAWYSCIRLVNANHYVNHFAVEIDGGAEVAELVAETYGFQKIGQLTILGNIYHFTHRSVPTRSKRSADRILANIVNDPNVRKVEQQKVLTRVKRRITHDNQDTRVKLRSVLDKLRSRVKRHIVHDKQVELPIREVTDKNIYQRHHHRETDRPSKNAIPGTKRSISQMGFNDPYAGDQWYLVNEGQTGGPEKYDLNTLEVWQRGITGKGVTVCVLDDGIDHNHPDLRKNYDEKASGDLNDLSDREHDPMPNVADLGNSHGTRCAGEVAAEANNNVCGVGIAYNAGIGGVRMLDGVVTDLLEAKAVNFNYDYVDIYSASWGPSDDGKTMEGPGTYCTQALEQGVLKGRNGKGSIFVWATGNGGMMGDDCSCDGYVSSIYSLSVGCISDNGLSTYFTEICPSTIAVVFTGGSHKPPGDSEYENPKLKVVTTDLKGGCTLEFQGTSSAAPLAAGCFALVLEANPDLTWRDMQHLVVRTSRIPNSEEDGWVVNGGGFHVNHKFGFGALDCGKLVELAQTWKTVPEHHKCEVHASNPKEDLPSGGSIKQTLRVDGCQEDDDSKIDYLEHVEVHIKMEHDCRGDISIVLVAPSGIESHILKVRENDNHHDGIDFTFMTVHNWGEDPRGPWTLVVQDNPGRGRHNHGKLLEWSLTLWGFGGDDPNGPKGGERNKHNKHERESDKAHDAKELEVVNIMAEETAAANHLNIKSVDDTEVEEETNGLGLSKSEMGELLRLLRGIDNDKRALNVNTRSLLDELVIEPILRKTMPEEDKTNDDDKGKGTSDNKSPEEKQDKSDHDKPQPKADEKPDVKAKDAQKRDEVDSSVLMAELDKLIAMLDDETK